MSNSSRIEEAAVKTTTIALAYGFTNGAHTAEVALEQAAIGVYARSRHDPEQMVNILYPWVEDVDMEQARFPLGIAHRDPRNVVKEYEVLLTVLEGQNLIG